MRFTETAVRGAWILDLDRFEDERGFFARTWCHREFGERGLETDVAQTNLSFTARRGTLRGMHYQRAPHEEVKIVRCVRGAIHDVIVDIRHSSDTCGRHAAVELTAENRRALYIPHGVAHGFQSLVDDTEVLYQMSTFYEPAAGAGVRWNDPTFGIVWPIAEPFMNERDASYPDWQRP